ncbi:MAG: helix-turn-helix transcriptional regulator [Sphingomonadales bacterium]|nr:helix-turn-helix transcriptional regulator [Sphingomonadales bacterium]NCQ22730.1 helix-turn-helix transcriptional regulator [Sphingomonadales bacterium]
MIIASNASEAIILHFVEPDTQMRAELARVALSVGYHCEIYADYAELGLYPPQRGIIIIRDDVNFGTVAGVHDLLMRLGISLPVIAMDEKPNPSRVVQAIKDGALDYITLPVRADKLAACISSIGPEAEQVTKKRHRSIHAQRALARLSPREAEVLDAVTNGGSNKEIARQLQISPRTVEIHRANMMRKLGLRHAAEAVRLKIESGLEIASMPMPQAA